MYASSPSTRQSRTKKVIAVTNQAHANLAQIARAHPHLLRHSLCTVMAEQHADVYAIQQRAGHKNISNTMIYTHVSDRQASDSCRSALMAAFG